MNTPLASLAVGALFGWVCAHSLVAAAVSRRSASSSAVVPASASYPGRAPGAGAVDASRRRIEAGNRALSVSWRRTERGFGPAALRDRQSGRSYALTGEVFQVVLADGRRYVASDLRPAADPVVTRLNPQPAAARLAARLPGQQVEWRLRSADDRLDLCWRALLHEGAGYARQELEVRPRVDGCSVAEVVWFDQALPGARVEGRVDGVPVVADGLFLGLENPHAAATVEGSQVNCRLRLGTPLPRGQVLASSFVLGVAPRGQMRRAFLSYLERERAHPYRPFLHYNSWYDTAWEPFALNETNCLEAIRQIGERLTRAHGVVLDAMVFDDGWDDPQTLWQFHRGFPNGFAPLAELCRQYDTRLGVWLSPFGGYGSPKEQRLKFGREQGFEINDTGFSLAGPRYYAAFRDACLRMMRRYGVIHFKFDGIAAGMYAKGGAQYLLDTEAMRRLMVELRREDPALYINLTTGSWPSPFWLRFADSLWRQGGDMGVAGKGSNQQQWLTYRDQETYRNIVSQSPLYPLNALMTQGVAYSRHGSAGDRTFNSAGFRDDVRAFFGGGTSLQELYIQPARLTGEDWAVLAEGARWARANASVLADTHWIGGDPGKLEVYGFAAWAAGRGTVTLRNPDDRPREFDLDARTAFELPPGAPERYVLRRPWREDADRPGIPARAGTPTRLSLAPFEVLVLDAIPAK